MTLNSIWEAIKFSCTPHPELFQENPSMVAASMIAPQVAPIVQAAAVKDTERNQ